jgi:hypothetical protein
MLGGGITRLRMPASAEGNRHADLTDCTCLARWHALAGELMIS